MAMKQKQHVCYQQLKSEVFFSVFFVRYLTFFYYLNEPTLGGETAFPIADNKTVPVNEVC